VLNSRRNQTGGAGGINNQAILPFGHIISPDNVSAQCESLRVFTCRGQRFTFHRMLLLHSQQKALEMFFKKM
jgi:hypothetical protein